MSLLWYIIIIARLTLKVNYAALVILGIGMVDL
jgi:hypothetical protein